MIKLAVLLLIPEIPFIPKMIEFVCSSGLNPANASLILGKAIHTFCFCRLAIAIPMASPSVPDSLPSPSSLSRSTVPLSVIRTAVAQ